MNNKIEVKATDVIDLLNVTYEVPRSICEQLKQMVSALDIITAKEVSMSWFNESITVEEYNEYWYGEPHKLSPEEFNLLKKVVR